MPSSDDLVDASEYDVMVSASKGDHASPGLAEYLDQSFRSFADGNNMTFSGYDFMKMAADERGALTISAEEANRELVESGIVADLSGSKYSRAYLDYLKGYHKRKQEREDFFARNNSTTNYILGTGTYFLSMFTDPVSVASAFVPVVSQARYARALQAAGGVVGRTGVRAAAGVVEGVAGAALVEPLVMAQQNALLNDYSYSDSLGNLLIGGVFGATAHSLAGLTLEAFESISRPRLYEMMMSDQKKAVLAQDSLIRVTEDLEPRVQQLVENDMRAAGVPEAEINKPAASGPSFESLLDQAMGVIANVRETRHVVTPDVLNVIKNMGGIKLRDNLGNLIDGAREFERLIFGSKDMKISKGGKTVKDYAWRGLINNKDGKEPDMVREALTEDGWFSTKDTGATEINDLYDLLQARAAIERADDFPIPQWDNQGMLTGRELRELNRLKEDMKQAGVHHSNAHDVAAKKLATYWAKKQAEEAAAKADEAALRDVVETGDQPVPQKPHEEPPDQGGYTFTPEDAEAVDALMKSGDDQKLIDKMVKDAQEEYDFLEKAGLMDETDDEFLRQADEVAEHLDRQAKAWTAALECMKGGI